MQYEDALHVNVKNIPLYASILRTEVFQRLYRIPFLGALSVPENIPNEDNRARHSIGVAALVLRYAQKLHLPKNEQYRLVASALLHDIHHLPFSHTMDLAFKKELSNFSFDKETKKLIVKKAAGTSLEDILVASGIDCNSLPIFNQSKMRDPIFRNTHNVDTLDGIPRAHALLFDGDLNFDRASTLIDLLVRGAKDTRVYTDCSSIFDDFWKTKNHVYVDGIYKKNNVIFERIVSYYLFDLLADKRMLDRVMELDYYDVLELSDKLKERLPLLKSLVNESVSAARADGENSWKVSVTVRSFTIDHREPIEAPNPFVAQRRYKVRKMPIIMMLKKRLVSDVEECLDYPRIHKRLPQIIENASDRLI